MLELDAIAPSRLRPELSLIQRVDAVSDVSDHAEASSDHQNLTIEAGHEYGHVRLTVVVRHDRSDWDNEGWRAIGDITLEPGEQLSQVARDVTALARG
ncbi:DUF6228 family protein [Georgenia sp. SUBG003]|uniref:DUF6228 family protein n=1 Tax=Georgenia sp. SUBG003 TaxID=1497974 RepID=UPI003AB8C0FE